MASIIWLSVFALLVIELAITLLLVLPLPRRLRHFLAKKIFIYGVGERIQFISKFIFLALVFAVADAISSLRRVIQKEEAETSTSGYPEGQAAYIAVSLDKQRKFRAERNMYLAGFALTLGFVITRLMELIQELVSREEETEQLDKKIAEFERMAKETHSATSPGEDDQEGTPMDDMSNSLTSNGIRRRSGAASAENESASTITTKTD